MLRHSILFSSVPTQQICSSKCCFRCLHLCRQHKIHRYNYTSLSIINANRALEKNQKFSNLLLQFTAALPVFSMLKTYNPYILQNVPHFDREKFKEYTGNTVLQTNTFSLSCKSITTKKHHSNFRFQSTKN